MVTGLSDNERSCHIRTIETMANPAAEPSIRSR